MSAVENINPETHPIPASWVPRVITGGKGPPEGPTTGDNWLSQLPLRAVFACRQNDKTVDWEIYTLMHKFEDIYQLVWEMPNGNLFTRRVHPQLFSNLMRDHRFIDILPDPYEQEAPQGDNDGSSEQRDQI